MKDWYKETEKAIEYLRDTEQEYSRYRGLMKSIPAREKIALARLMLDVDNPETSAAGRKMWAEAHKEYERVVDESQEIQTECDLLTAKRDRAALTIEVWRSWQSAKTKGVIA